MTVLDPKLFSGGLSAAQVDGLGLEELLELEDLALRDDRVALELVHAVDGAASDLFGKFGAEGERRLSKPWDAITARAWLCEHIPRGE